MLSLLLLVATMSGCVVYDPGDDGYGYAPAYGPSYAYAPPAYGSFDFFVDGDGGGHWHGGHEHGGWGGGGHGWH